MQGSARWETERLGAIPQPLLAWYDRNARVLPWRSDPKPYHVWVSEIMLQQTRVAAVMDYYERFLRELPTLAALAEAEEETLLKLWEGLGYYRRVRNLQKAARTVMERFGGEIPASFQELRQLAGIGDYTAGAIASIAFGEKVPVVDGNVLRVVMRVLASEDNIDKAKTKKQVWDALQARMPQERSGDFNQAMMELGAMVCLPGGPPLCADCPLGGCCLAKERGEPLFFPVRDEKKKRKIEDKTVFVLQAGGAFALRKRSEKGLLAGLWELPWVDGALQPEGAQDVLEDLGFGVEELRELPRAKHIFTHIEWHMRGYFAKVTPPLEQEGLVFATPRELRERYTIPSAFAAYRGVIAGDEALLGEIMGEEPRAETTEQSEL